MPEDRRTPKSRDPSGVLISVHADLCVSSVFHMFVIDSQKSKSKRLLKIITKIIAGNLCTDRLLSSLL